MFERPSKDEYFLFLAFAVSLNSEDYQTQHGSVIINNLTKHVIATGVNGLFRGADRNEFDLTRPEKYKFFIHSEESAIMNAKENPLNLPKGATLYVTGKPCINCLQRVINFGITRIVMAARQGTQLENKESDELFDKIVRLSKIEVVEMDTLYIKNLLRHVESII